MERVRAIDALIKNKIEIETGFAEDGSFAVKVKKEGDEIILIFSFPHTPHQKIVSQEEFLKAFESAIIMLFEKSGNVIEKFEVDMDSLGLSFASSMVTVATLKALEVFNVKKHEKTEVKN